MSHSELISVSAPAEQPSQAFAAETAARIHNNSENSDLAQKAWAFLEASTGPKYSYNFAWLGRPIIQYPQDIVALQEIVWSIKPELIVETGIAHGGSLVFYASLLELNAICGGPADAYVMGIDIEIRPHNRRAIETHPLARRIAMIEGSSTAPDVIAQVRSAAEQRRTVLICLDSNHTHAHVLAELEAYAPLTTVGSYCVVFDTVIAHLPADMYPDRPWGPTDNPGTAVRTYLASHPEFAVDHEIDHKLLISVSPGGYLKRVAR